MKKTYAIGAAAAAVFMIFALLSLNSSKIEYASFGEAKKSGKIAQVVCKRSSEKPWRYDSKTGLLTFSAIDSKKTSASVRYRGPLPNNFDVASGLVLKGKFVADTFVASDIYTKCPSKYQGKNPLLHKNEN